MMTKLMEIQTKLKAPKNLYNKFGKYNYRNAEGIYEAVKPYLADLKCTLIISDEIIEVGGRIYVKATATLRDTETLETVSASAMAREANEHKGMDESQITGTASSYARKYALNGLFLLDDTKDADSDEHRIEMEEKQKSEAKQRTDEIAGKAVADGVPLGRICSLYKVSDIESMTEKQYQNCIDNWEKIKEMK